MTVLICCAGGIKGNYKVPDTVLTIDNFYGCPGLSSITITDNVIEINNAFWGCDADFTIYGTADSNTEEYASEENIRFISDYSVPTVEKSVDGKSVEITLNPNEGASVPYKAIAIFKDGNSIVGGQDCEINNNKLTADISGNETSVVLYFWDSLEGMHPIDGAIPMAVGI